MGNSTLKYFSWKWITIGTLVGIIATELLGKGMVLVDTQGKPLPEFFQDVYQFLTIGGGVFTVMTGLGVLTGCLAKYSFHLIKEDNTVGPGGAIFLFACTAIFGVVFSIISVPIFGIFGMDFGFFFGGVLGFILGVLLRDISVKMFLRTRNSLPLR